MVIFVALLRIFEFLGADGFPHKLWRKWPAEVPPPKQILILLGQHFWGLKAIDFYIQTTLELN